MDREGSHTMAMKRAAAHLSAESDPELAAEPVDPDVVTRKLNNHLVPWLFSLGVLCYLDRTNLSFAALELNRDLGLSCSTYGLGAALFFVSYALFQMPSTMVCARLGAPAWLSINIVAWGTVACLFAAANSVPVFLALRFLLGATESAAFPGMWYHLSLFYPADTSGSAQSGAAPTGLGAAYARVASCTALAQVLGAPLAAAILAMDGAAGLRGWQWLFLLEGAATVVFGVALRFGLAPSPAKARMLTHAEREWLVERQEAAARQAAGGGASVGRDAGGSGLLAAIKRPLGVVRDWRILWMAGCWLLVAAVMFGMTFFMPLLVAAMFSDSGGLSGGGSGHRAGCSGGGHGPATEADKRRSVLVALATAIPFIAAAVGMNINARLAERANERHRHAGVPILLAGGTLALTPLALRFVGPSLAFTCLSLAAGFCWSFHGPFFSWPAVFLSGEQAAAGFAFINSVGAVGGFIGPYLLGRLSDRADGGFTAAMVTLACFLCASGAGLLLFPAPGQRPSEETRGKERAGNDSSSRAGLQAIPSGDAAEDDEDGGEGLPLAGSSSGERAGWGGLGAPSGEEQWEEQQREQQRGRHRGGGAGGGSSRSLSQKGSRGSLEFQPILALQGEHSS